MFDVAAFRRRNKLTQAQLAKKLGRPVSTIQAWEAGPSDKDIQAMLELDPTAALVATPAPLRSPDCAVSGFTRVGVAPNSW